MMVPGRRHRHPLGRGMQGHNIPVAGNKTAISYDICSVVGCVCATTRHRMNLTTRLLCEFSSSASAASSAATSLCTTPSIVSHGNKHDTPWASQPHAPPGSRNRLAGTPTKHLTQHQPPRWLTQARLHIRAERLLTYQDSQYQAGGRRTARPCGEATVTRAVLDSSRELGDGTGIAAYQREQSALHHHTSTSSRQSNFLYAGNVIERCVNDSRTDFR